MENKKHWQSFGELNNSEAYQQSVKDEFKEELPFEADDNSSFLETATPRRDFLKYLGFSTAAAAVAASCEVPVKKAIPFANKPENVIPGVANWYATTYVQDGDVVSVIAKVRDGRPIKIEGNSLSPIYQGGTSAKVQASVLDLYDTARVRKPMIRGGNGQFNEATFESIDNAVAADMAQLGGNAVVLLTSTITSPSTKEIINQFLSRYPGSRHVTYDAVSCSGMLLANEQTGNGRRIPSYRFNNARVIVSLSADFLGTWLSPVEFNKQYAETRRVDPKNPVMSKHFQFEPVLSQTGANADERYLHLPSQTGMVAAALLGAINGQGVSGINDAQLADGIKRAAAELMAHRGAGLVVSGSNDVNVQIIVNAINAAIGAYGTTIDWSTPVNYRQGVDNDMATLIADMNAGRVGALLIHGANPAYSWLDAAGFTNALKRVPVTVSFNPRLDETATLCKYIIPDHHFLESWGDAEPKQGYYSFIQPTIHPLFKTRQWQDSLLRWMGNSMPYAAFLKQYWSSRSGGEAGWDKILQDGVLNPGGARAATQPAGNTSGRDTLMATTPGPRTTGGAGSFSGGAVGTAVSAVSARKGGEYELYLYQNVGIGNGNGASNPWLQELPDPVTRATWDNYLIVSPAFAKEVLNIDLNNSGQSDRYEAYPDKPIVEVSVNGKTMELPCLIIPGTHPRAIGVAVGYGRIASVGKASQWDGKPIGVNAYPFATWANGTVDFANYNVSVKKTGRSYKVALVQTHNTYDTPQGKRTEVMKELSLATYQQRPSAILEARDKELSHWGGVQDFEKKGTIYPYHEKPGIKWGMSIDLNTCTGCHACVVACHVENNVPVVGKNEVMRFHDMHWLRIDRYYSGDMNNPNVVFQPMLCQHCDNAPCENVCPVAATMHNQEGVNQMAYNRCIGTRYCANNCPYKVRRFNWSDYLGADSFPGNHDEWDELRENMNDPLTRMVLNPDVTVRSRGVMEKCSFCIQRTQAGKLQAKKESRPLVTGENDQWDVKTACQQACPTDAIVFGNANAKDSAVTQHRALNINRTYYSLEQLHTLPNVNYLAKVRNTDRMVESGIEVLEDARHGGNVMGGDH